VMLVEVSQYNDFHGGITHPLVFICFPFIHECVDALVAIVVIIYIE